MSTASSARVCIHAYGERDSAWLEHCLTRLSPDIRVTLVGALAPIAITGRLLESLVANIGSDDASSVLRTCAAAYPGDDLALLRAGTVLPEFWFERITRALQVDDVLAVSALDNLDTLRAPLPAGAQSDASPAEIDRLCYLYSHKQYLHCATVSPLLSAWHGPRLRTAGVATLKNLAVPAVSAPLHAVLLDHLYVAAPGRILRGPKPPQPGADADTSSALGELREQVAAALSQLSDASAHGFPGLDGKPVVLHILHGWGGGAERFVRDLAAADSACHHLVLIARGNSARRCFGEELELLAGNFSQPPLRRITLPNAIADTALHDATYRDFLAQIVREYCVDALLVSSLIGHSLDALRTGLPLLIVGHDFYPLWPILHRDFGDTQLRFDDAQLVSDLTSANAQLEFANRDPAYWRRLREQYVAALLQASAVIVTPSRSALTNLQRIEPRLKSLRSKVIGHGLAAWPPGAPLPLAEPARRTRLRLVVPGRVRRGKGAELLRAALPKLREHAEIFLLGAGKDGEEFFGERDVHIVLNYQRDELPVLIAKIAPDAALLLPTVAETFSYTLSEMWSLGVPVVATELGSLAERIEDGVSGWLAAANAAAINRVVAHLDEDRDSLEQVRLNLVDHAEKSLQAMSAEYCSCVPLPQPAIARYALQAVSNERLVIAELHTRLGESSRALSALSAKLETQQAELEKRSDWATGLDRELKQAARILEQREIEIDERTIWANSLQDDIESAQDALTTLHAEFDERTQWALAQQAAIAQLDEHVQTLEQIRLQQLQEYHELQMQRDQIERARDEFETERNRLLASRSWRLTKPLRWLARRARSARIRLAFLLTRMRSVHGRVRGSLARRGLKGTIARAAQELTQDSPFAPLIVVEAPTQDFAPHVLPTSSSPTVSIVIPVYNKFAYTDACLRSLAEHAGTTAFEVIVVDDGSSDDTATCLVLIDGIQTIRNAENLGFVGSCNAGAAQARGEFLLFLNNDTVVTPGWLEALVNTFAEEPRAGLVGAKLVYPDGRLQEAGGIIFSNGSGWNYGRFEDPAAPQFNYRREVDYCSGAAIMLRRALFEQLGGFDMRYAPAYYEDTDLAFAVRAAGLKVIYEPRATVVHFEGITSGTDTGSGIKRFQVVNQQKFLDKWSAALALQPAPDTRIEIAREHRIGARALIIDACVPAPDQDSGSLRMVNLMRVLIDLDYKVSFFADNRAYDEKYTPPLQQLGVEALYHPYLNDTVRFLREHGSLFDVIVISRHYIAANYIDLVRLYAPQARLIFDTVDLHYLREERAAALVESADIAREAAKTKVQELRLMRDCDVTLVVSPVEREILAREVPEVRIEVLSNVHEVFGCRRPFGERHDLVFVGGFQHPPNIDAVQFFVREVFPHVRARLPHVQFHVIGSKAPAEILELQAEGVIVHGFLPDITPYMDGCRLSIAPLRYGAGVKGKVNMAMSYGLPVVATEIAVEGMHVRNGEDVLVADDPQELAALIVRAYSDETLWQQLSMNGLENVRRHFSFDAARRAVETILRK